jgi:hypothetical protein
MLIFKVNTFLFSIHFIEAIFDSRVPITVYLLTEICPRPSWSIQVFTEIYRLIVIFS